MSHVGLIIMLSSAPTPAGDGVGVRGDGRKGGGIGVEGAGVVSAKVVSAWDGRRRGG